LSDSDQAGAVVFPAEFIKVSEDRVPVVRYEDSARGGGEGEDLGIGETARTSVSSI
jgi:hypothetical protein